MCSFGPDLEAGRRADDDRALYQTILGLQALWDVERVELREATQEVDVWVGATPGTTLRCPHCGDVAPIYDHVERRWRHLDTCQFRTLLCARVPRLQCATHGATTVSVPWAEAGARFTLLFERLAIAWLREATPTAVARRLGLSWDEARGIMERAVRRGLQRREPTPVPYLGIDAKSFLKRHQYVSVVVDLEHARILHVADDRKASSLVPYFTTLTNAQRGGIAAIAMDMWEPYRHTVRAHVPDADAKIVFDKFHVLQHVANAVDQVRRQEHKALVAVGDTRLTRTKYAWLKNPANFSAKAWRDFAALRTNTLHSARARAMKESRPPAQGASRQHSHVPDTSHHQRRDGRAQREDSVDQIQRAWLSQSRRLQDGDLLLLWRIRSGAPARRPTNPLETLKSQNTICDGSALQHTGCPCVPVTPVVNCCCSIL